MAVRKARKLLTAAVGVATVSYVVGCGRTATEDERSGRQISSDTSSDDGSGSNTAGQESTTSEDRSTLIAGNLVAPPPTPTTPISGNLVAPPTDAWPDTSMVGPGTEVTAVSSEVVPTDSSWIAGNLVAPSGYPYPTEPPDVSSETPTTGPWGSQETGLVGTVDTGYGSSGATDTVPPVNTDTPSDTVTPPETSAPAVTGSPIPSGDLDAGAAPDASLVSGAGQ